MLSCVTADGTVKVWAALFDSGVNSAELAYGAAATGSGVDTSADTAPASGRTSAAAAASRVIVRTGTARRGPFMGRPYERTFWLSAAHAAEGTDQSPPCAMRLRT